MSFANRQSIQQAVCRQTYLCSILRSAIAEPANIRRQSAANSCLLFSDTELTLEENIKSIAPFLVRKRPQRRYSRYFALLYFRKTMVSRINIYFYNTTIMQIFQGLYFPKSPRGTVPVGDFLESTPGGLSLWGNFVGIYMFNFLFKAFRTRFLSALHNGATRVFFDPSPVIL